jgi:hypothetical protein
MSLFVTTLRLFQGPVPVTSGGVDPSCILRIFLVACKRSDYGYLDVVRTYRPACLSPRTGFAFRLPGASGDSEWKGCSPAATSPLLRRVSRQDMFRDGRGSGASAGSVGVARTTQPYARRERKADLAASAGS